MIFVINALIMFALSVVFYRIGHSDGSRGAFDRGFEAGVKREFKAKNRRRETYGNSRS